MSETKIVATIGPATCRRDDLLALHKAGMSVARLNGSHNSLDWHQSTIELIQDLLPDVPILLDIPGRKIRTIELAHEYARTFIGFTKRLFCEEINESHEYFGLLVK